MLSEKMAKTMQRIVSRGVERFTLTNALQELIDSGLGTKRGRSAYFTAKDKDEMRDWLSKKGYALRPIDVSEMSRGERLAVTPNEKAGGSPLKRGRVSIKALGDAPLVIGDRKLFLPPSSHLDTDWTAIADKIGHTCILVVENYENFNRIHETLFDLPEEFQSPLVIYRGDPFESRFDNVLSFLSNVKLPVLAFMDADPAGIAIAGQFESLIGLLLPTLDILEKQLSNPRTARKDLFIEQYPVYCASLDALELGHPCRRVWDVISKFSAGVVQERWVNAGYRVSLWAP